MIYSIPYLFVFIIEFFFSNNICKSNPLIRKNYSYLYSIFVILNIVFFGLRGFINTDAVGYFPFFENTPSLFSSYNEVSFFLTKGDFARWGKGFLIYSIIIKTITKDYFIWQFITFSLQYFLILNFLKKYLSDLKWLGLLFFFIFGFFTIMLNLFRNCFSIIFFLYSIKYISEKKIIRFILLNLIGTTFHTTAFLFIPFYFINRRFSKIIILITFCIGNIIYLLQISWVYNFAEALSSINTDWYILFEFYSKSKVFSAAYGITIGYIERFLSFVLIFVFSNKLVKRDQRNQIFINFFYTYVFIYLFFSEMNILVSRLPLLFIFVYWIIYPQIYTLLKKREKALFLFCLIMYGMLKVTFSTNTIMFSYNSMFHNMSYENYKQIFNQYSKTL